MVKEQRISNKIVRQSFAKIDEALEMPNLIDVQKKSYEWSIWMFFTQVEITVFF